MAQRLHSIKPVDDDNPANLVDSVICSADCIPCMYRKCVTCWNKTVLFSHHDGCMHGRWQVLNGKALNAVNSKQQRRRIQLARHDPQRSLLSISQEFSTSFHSLSICSVIIQIEIFMYTVVRLDPLRYVPPTVQDMWRMNIYEWQWSVVDSTSHHLGSNIRVLITTNIVFCKFDMTVSTLYSTTPNAWAAKSSLLTMMNPLMASRGAKMCSDTFDSAPKPSLVLWNYNHWLSLLNDFRVASHWRSGREFPIPPIQLLQNETRKNLFDLYPTECYHSYVVIGRSLFVK